jgi:hypothetical protein
MRSFTAGVNSLEPGDDILNKVTVNKMLATLTEEQQAILILRFKHNMCFREIGEIIGTEFRDPPEALPESTIRYLYYKIKTQLNRNFRRE